MSIQNLPISEYSLLVLLQEARPFVKAYCTGSKLCTADMLLESIDEAIAERTEPSDLAPS